MKDGRLEKGDYVRVRLADTEEWSEGFIQAASPGNPSSVLVQVSAVRMRKGAVCAGALPLTVDYEAETAISLFGDAYEIDVVDNG